MFHCNGLTRTVLDDAHSLHKLNMKTGKTNLLLRLDHLEWSRWHTKICIILGIGWAMDAFETQISTSSIRVISDTFSITDSTRQNLITSVWTTGGFVGSLLFGWVCDSYGRKWTFMLTLIMYSFFTICTSLAWSFETFLVFRALTSIGVAAEYSAVTSSVAEFVPSKYRGKTTTLILGLWSVGAIIATGVNVLIIPTMPKNIGWRVAFSLGSLAALFALWSRRSIPESPRFLIEKGQLDEAERVVTFIEQQAKQEDNWIGIEAVPFTSHSNTNFFSQLAKLLYHHPFPTAFCCIMDLSQAFGGYGVSSFVAVKLLPAAGFPDESIPLFYFVGALCTIPGTFIAAYLIDRIGRKKLLPIAFFVAAITAILNYPAAKSENHTWMFAAFGLYNLGYTLAWNTSYPIYAELFPSQYRGTGIGFAVAIGRIGGFAAPFVLASAYDSAGNVGALLVVASFFLITTVVSIPFAIYGIEATGKSLEESSGFQFKGTESTEELTKK